MAVLVNTHGRVGLRLGVPPLGDVGGGKRAFTMNLDTCIKESKYFWPHAKCTHSFPRNAEGCRKYRAKFDLMFGAKKFIRFRRYVGPDGEVRRTVEIEI